jgi:hypothetical protein
MELANPKFDDLSTLPLDILLHILDFLANDFHLAPSYTTSKAIFGLASSCQRLSDVVEFWILRNRKREITLPGGTRFPLNIQEPTTLADMCKPLAWICAKCNNRATLRPSPRIEPFTNLQLCQACDTFLFPKISLKSVRQLYILRKDDGPTSGGWNIPCTSLVTRTIFAWVPEEKETLFRWQDIAKLAKERKWILHGDFIYANPYLGLYGLSELHRSTTNGSSFPYIIGDPAVVRTDYPRFETYRLFHDNVVLLSHVGFVQNRAGEYQLPEKNWDELLFHHFRFHFDPAWKKETHEEGHKTYTSCLANWVHGDNFATRPWAPKWFPTMPDLEFPDLKEENGTARTDREWRNLELYRRHCSKLRAGCKIYPNILSDPSMWTTRKRQMTKSTWLRAAAMANERPGPSRPATNFEIRLR